MYLFIKCYYRIKALLKILFYKAVYGSKLQCGLDVAFRKNFSLGIIGGGKIIIQNNVFFNHYCSLYAMNEITIGEGTIFGENVKIYDHNHCYKDTSLPIKVQGYTSAPIRIGKHCWIASNVTILKGVTIGDNCVIGAGCVVYKDVPEGCVVVNKQTLAYM